MTKDDRVRDLHHRRLHLHLFCRRNKY
jgi:hypothetical protein